MATESTQISLTRIGDSVHVGSSRDGGSLFFSTLDLPGGFLTYDVRDLGDPPTAQISDTEAANHWMTRIYGLDLVDHVRGSAHIGTTHESVEVNVSPDPSASVLARIAFGQWLWRFWPSTDDPPPIDEFLLRLELASLAWEADDYFTFLQPASTFLAGSLDTLRELAVLLVDATGEIDALLLDVVKNALDAVVVGPAGPALTDDEPLLDTLDDLLSQLLGRSKDERGDVRVDIQLNEWLIERDARRARISEGAMRSDYALVAGDSSEGLASPTRSEGAASVDWTQVPPRVLDWNENTVRWAATRLDGLDSPWEVTVRATASPQIEDNLLPRLLARGYVPDGTVIGNLPVLAIALSRVDGYYEGTGYFETDTVNELIVDVYAASSTRRPNLSLTERISAEREREEARKFIRRRFYRPTLKVDAPDRRFLGEPANDG